MSEEYFDISQKKYYTPCTGTIGSKTVIYNEYIHIQAKIFFDIIKKSGLEFYVFTETNIVSMNKYNIMIFDKSVKFFEKNVIQKLCEFGYEYNFEIYGCKIISKKRELDKEDTKNFFACDIFYSKVDSENFVKNICSDFGMNNQYELTYDMVYPAKILKIDDMELPFFNKTNGNILLEYEDDINDAKNNTINYITKNKDFKYERDINFNKNTNFTSVFDALKYVNINNGKEIRIMNEKFLEYTLSIKYFYPEIKIIFYLFDEIKKQNLVFLNYVDVVKCKSNELKEKYENYEFIYVINKPIFGTIRVITFGTYDLFHIGHYNILKRSRDLGEKLIVGISSDILNEKKGKISVNKTEKRVKDVMETKFAAECFVEESLEEKDNYIKKYECDLLVMGDDWEDKFDWVSCPCIYFPRTPNISTTMLKEEIKKLERCVF
jgi:glycerol-3-phosphate cytidylyltransferase